MRKRFFVIIRQKNDKTLYFKNRAEMFSKNNEIDLIMYALGLEKLVTATYLVETDIDQFLSEIDATFY